MLSKTMLTAEVPPLQHYPWPPVNPSGGLDPDLRALLSLALPQQRQANVLLWRPAYTYRKYGFFLITESWVAPHFTPLLAGLQRVGLAHKDVGVYFEAHLTIDPHHGEELVTGFSHHAPPLNQWQVDEVLWGAHCAIAAYVMQCDYVLPYLVQMA